MDYQPANMARLAELVGKHSPSEGINRTCVENVGTFKSSAPMARILDVEPPAIVIVVSGRKQCYLDNDVYEYGPGTVTIGFYPIPMVMEITEASSEKPYLLAAVLLDLRKMADMQLRLERHDVSADRTAIPEPSVFFATHLTDRILDPFIRLFEALSDPGDSAILVGPIVDEIYYRLLRGPLGGELRSLVEHNGKILRISKAVDYIHANLDESVSVAKLADMVNMSRSVFFQNFREIMRLSPLQYSKSVKLLEARRLIKEGNRVNEACYSVGYNNLAQFSREYKRQFGFVPSAT